VSTNKLLSYFDNYIPLNSKEKEELGKRVVEKKLKRRQFILQENEVCKHYTFVVSGLLKMYAVDGNASEHNIQFACEDEWITDNSSFHSEKPSRLCIEAIEPSVVLQIDKPNLIYLFHNHTKFDRIFRVIAENKNLELQNRVLQNISSTGEERYITFLDQYQHLINRLPNTQIASYLGITPEFLSKIRSTISKK